MDLPTIAQALQAGFYAACGAGLFLALRFCARWLKDQIVDGVDERTNGRVGRQIDARCDELERNVDARLERHEQTVGVQSGELMAKLDDVAASNRVTARVLTRHVRWAASQIDHEYPDPALDDLEDLREVSRPHPPPEAPS